MIETFKTSILRYYQDATSILPLMSFMWIGFRLYFCLVTTSSTIHLNKVQWIGMKRQAWMKWLANFHKLLENATSHPDVVKITPWSQVHTSNASISLMSYASTDDGIFVLSKYKGLNCKILSGCAYIWCSPI